MITKDKLTEIFCIADDFYNENEIEIKKHLLEAPISESVIKKRNRKGELSHSEIIAILICYYMGTFHNFKHYYCHFILIHMIEEFPDAVSYNRFIDLQPRVIVPLMLMLKLVGFSQCIGITYVYTTPIRVCHNKRIKRNKTFKDIAAIGKGTMFYFFGFKLNLVCNEKGQLLNFTLTKEMLMIGIQMCLTLLAKIFLENFMLTKDTYPRNSLSYYLMMASI